MVIVDGSVIVWIRWLEGEIKFVPCCDHSAVCGRDHPSLLRLWGKVGRHAAATTRTLEVGV